MLDRRNSLVRWLLGPLLLVVFAAPARADDEDEKPDFPTTVPVRIAAEVDASHAAATGRWDVTLIFTPEEKVTRPYSVYMRISWRGRSVLRLDHAPEIPTRKWRGGKVVRYTIPIPVPVESGIRPEDTLGVMVGFFDAEADQMIDPLNEKLSNHFVHVATLTVPTLAPTDEEGVKMQLLERASKLAAEGNKADAWAVLELGIRRAAEDPTKYDFRDALTKLGHFEARPISLLEKQIVARRIQDEKRRYLRLMAGRYFDRGRLWAALRILEAVGGKISEEAGEAVIGALAEAKRAQKDIQQIQLRILGNITKEDKAAAQDAINKLGLTKKLLEKADSWFKDKAYGKARYVLRELMLVRDRDLAVPSRAKLDEVNAAWLADTPPEEEALVEKAVNHPSFGRIGTVATHNFIYIGPRTMIEAIPVKSRLRFDLAYIFQTDLFGRLPNPGGDRITVFWKELWDFGGGQAGGRTIDIGRADPARKGYRVDTGLMYHELTHCIDDTSPILNGFREGLANMGAAYTFEAIGQKGDTLHAFERNLFAFRKDYLERDMPYWRIQSYGPSAGFFLHFVDKYKKRGKGHDWKSYRTFFRDYRRAPVRDGREPYIARALAYYLIRCFGDGAFDDLMNFRFPLVPSDREAVKRELEAFARGDYALRKASESLEDDAPNSPIPRDLKARRMIRAFQSKDHETAKQISQEELGILHDWWVIGPFESRGSDPRATVFPPEYEIDFKKEYPGGSNVCKWRKAGDTGLVAINSMGWVDFNFNYQNNTATYALTHVTVDRDVDAAIHLRCDDDFFLFVNDKLIEGYINRGRAGSDWLWWRGPAERAPDAMRLSVKLKKGRNKIFLKVKNRSGGAGFILAVAEQNGQPVKGLVTDLDPPQSGKDTAAEPRKSAWKTRVKHRFTKKAFKSKLAVTVGSFKVENKQLVGQSTDKRVGWRKYTVRPGFPKDSPSNLFWFKEKYTKELQQFRLRLDVATKNKKPPKMVITFMGEGETDGLSGWNLIVHPKGKKVAARLERYDILVYQTRGEDYKPAEDEDATQLVLTYIKGRFTAKLGECVLLDKVPIKPIKGRSHIGVSTYGPGLGITYLKLEALPE